MKQFLQSTKVLVLILFSFFSNNTFGQYTGTGTFTKVTALANLTDGYYVIVNETDEFVMTNGRTGSATGGYFTSANITLTSGSIVNPPTTQVWKIETNGSGKTIYNETIAKYVGWSSGSSASIEDVPANSNRWTFSYGASKWTVNNVATAVRQLSYNSSANPSRFAAYGNTGQEELQLYKLAGPSGKTVTFNGNSGTSTMAPQSSGVPANLTLNQFLKTGYSFQNWHTIMSGTGGISYADGQQYDFSADMILYAQWKINQYNITYNANGSTGGAVPATQTADYNTNVTLDSNSGALVRAGYTFNGWNTNAAGGAATHYNAGASFMIPANDVTLFAEWVSNAPSLTTTGTITAMTTTYGTLSTASNFTLNGVNLTGANITVTPPTGFELSTTSGGTYASALSLPIAAGSVSSPVYVRLTSTTNAGNYNGNITLTDGATSATIAIPSSTVSPKALTISGLTAANKIYDGDTSATLVGSAALVGIVNSDAVILSGSGVGAFANKNVNTGIVVSVTGYTLSGTKASNYTLTQPTSTADITKVSITISVPTIASKPYDGFVTTGTITKGIVSGTVGGETLTITPTGNFTDANVGTAKPATISYTVEDGTGLKANYSELAESSAAGDITAVPPKITLTAMNLNVNGTANITSNSTGAMVYTSANPAIASVSTSGVVTGLALGSTTISVSQAAQGNYTDKTETITVMVTDVTTGTYRTTEGGSWPGGTKAAKWERMTTTGWSVATPASGATDLLIIRHAVTSNGNIAASGGIGTKMQIDDQGAMAVSQSSTFASLLIKKGGTFDAAATGITFNTNAPLDVEDGGKLIISAALANSSALWKAKENFAKGSTVEVSNYSGAFFANPPQIDTNADGYYFGNLTFSGSTAITLIGTNAVTDFKLTEGDLSVLSSANSILVTSQNKSVDITVNGSVNVNAGLLRIGGGNGSATLTVNNNFNLNGGVLNIGPTNNNSLQHYLKLKGNLTTATGTTLQSTDIDSDIDFIGNHVQYVDVAGVTNTARFRIKKGASVELKNNLVLNNNSEFSVEDGATLNFGYKTSDSSPSIISNSGTGTNKFALEDGGTIKITHPKGVVKSVANDGNVQLAVSNKTFSSNATYHYIGKVNQEMGDALSTSSTKNVFVELANNALTISPSAQFGVTNSGVLDIRVGRLIENDVNFITGGSTSANAGILKMATGTQYYITKASATPGDSEYVPRFYNINLSGGEIVLASTGNQTLRGGRTYKNLTFSNGGEKGVSTGTALIDNVLIKDNTIVNTGDFEFGGTSTALTMQNTALLKISGGGTKPDMGGAYTLAPTTKIEFAGGSVKNIRLAPTYANITVSGDNVSVNSTLGGLTLQSGTSFHVADTGVFKLQNENGFSGANNTAIKNTNNPSIVLDPLSVIEYNGNKQVVSHAMVVSPADAHYQNLRVSNVGVKTATGTTKVKDKVYVVGGELKLPGTANNIAPNVLWATNGIQNTGGVVTFENNAILMQANTANNNGDIKVLRKARVPAKQYNLWASPIEGQDLYALYAAIATVPKGKVMEYITKTDFFEPVAVGTRSVVGKGYSVIGLSVSDVIANFVGKPNNGTIQTVLSTEGNRFNAVGNPYPSNLDLGALYTSNASVLDFGNAIAPSTLLPTMYFWDNSNNTQLVQQGSGYEGQNYAVYNALLDVGIAATNGDSSKRPNGLVKPGQGFIVSAKANSGNPSTLVFDNTMRTERFHNATDAPYFKTVNDNNKFWLKLESSTGIFNTLVVAYDSRAINDYDLFDSLLLNPSGDDLFFTMSDDNEELGIQGRGRSFDKDDVVKLGFKNFKPGVHTISLQERYGIFDESQAVYLKDKLLSTVVNLSRGGYSFQASTGTKISDRFEIVYKESSLGVLDSVKIGIEVYKTKDHFTVKSDQKITKLELYDITGRLIAINDRVSNEAILSHVGVNNGVYVLKIYQNNKVIIKKVIK
ncbi:YDG domain-containing protein [Chryseobacterium sp. T1]